jgi:hypothetical protein
LFFKMSPWSDICILHRNVIQGFLCWFTNAGPGLPAGRTGTWQFVLARAGVTFCCKDSDFDQSLVSVF